MLRKVARIHQNHAYESIKDGIGDSCEHWQHRPKGPKVTVKYGLIFNLSSPSWLLAINVDWSQRFTHICDSVGAIYLVIYTEKLNTNTTLFSVCHNWEFGVS